MQHPHRDDMARPIGPRLQMLRNIHNVLVRIYARSRRRSDPQVAVGVLRLFGLYLQAKEQMYPKGLGNRQDILFVPIIECTSLRLVEVRPCREVERLMLYTISERTKATY